MEFFYYFWNFLFELLESRRDGYSGVNTGFLSINSSETGSGVEISLILTRNSDVAKT
jgi:hypothetical protein